MKGQYQYMVRCASSIFMMLVLLWLTVSTPFVNSFQQQVAAQEKAEEQKTRGACTDKDDPAACNPFANTTEEKTESSSITFSEEYLHDHFELIHTLDDLLKHDNCDHSALYIAFHGELLSPPPEL